MIDREKHTSLALQKMRELLRDVLYLKYDEGWTNHNRFAGGFFAEPTDEEKQLLALLLGFADGDASAIAAVNGFQRDS